MNCRLLIAASKPAASMLISALLASEEIKYSSVVLTSAKFSPKTGWFYNDQTTFAPLACHDVTAKLFIHDRNFGSGQKFS